MLICLYAYICRYGCVCVCMCVRVHKKGENERGRERHTHACVHAYIHACMNTYRISPVQYVGTWKVDHVAHIADLVRLQVCEHSHTCVCVCVCVRVCVRACSGAIETASV